MAEDKGKKKGMGRREFLKAAAATPVVGAFAAAVVAKGSSDKKARADILGDIGGNKKLRVDLKRKKLNIPPSANNTLNIGFIGIGGRGSSIMRSAGFAQPDQLRPGMQLGTEGEEPLNIRCTAVCDLFDPRVEYALKAAGGTAKAYRTYQELLDQSDVDAVVIATPDHYHAWIAKAAAEAGKHVYVEKCMTRKIEEAVMLHDAVKKAGIVFQLGHQNRNSTHFESAMNVIDNGILGEITLIQCYTNRNDRNGAWVYDIPKEHGPKNAAGGARNLDWEQYVAVTTQRPYDPNRFFRWRCYWDYGTGLSGDLLTHELDVINMVMQLGIPDTCVASGGVYYHKEYKDLMTASGDPIGSDDPVPAGAVPRPDAPVLKREVPDVFQVVFEYKARNLTVVYNATLSSEHERGQIYMGSEATMDLSNGCDVYADPQSKRYAEKIKSGAVRMGEPMISFKDIAGKGIEALTSATSQWTLSKGLLYTYREGRRVDVTYLHLKNWIDHIRANDHDTMCNIEDGMVEATTAHMATLSFMTGQRVRWDAENRKIVSDTPSAEQLAVIG